MKTFQVYRIDRVDVKEKKGPLVVWMVEHWFHPWFKVKANGPENALKIAGLEKPTFRSRLAVGELPC